MHRTTVEPKTVVHEIVCDRCRKEVQREGGDFELMTSIGFEAGYASIFGDGNRVEIDLCESCVRDTLGTWLRVRTPEDTPLARILDKFRPEVQCGEFAGRDPQSLGDLVRSADPPDAEEAVAETPPPRRTSVFTDSWVPVAELFNRLADGERLEQILEALPQITRHGASHALREAALRFPPYACFRSAADVTLRHQHER